MSRAFVDRAVQSSFALVWPWYVYLCTVVLDRTLISSTASLRISFLNLSTETGGGGGLAGGGRGPEAAGPWAPSAPPPPSSPPRLPAHRELACGVGVAPPASHLRPSQTNGVKLPLIKNKSRNMMTNAAIPLGGLNKQYGDQQTHREFQTNKALRVYNHVSNRKRVEVVTSRFDPLGGGGGEGRLSG